jgi:hypothetical protein
MEKRPTKPVDTVEAQTERALERLRNPHPDVPEHAPSRNPKDANAQCIAGDQPCPFHGVAHA